MFAFGILRHYHIRFRDFWEIFKKGLDIQKKECYIINKFYKCFLKGCDEDGRELKFTESRCLVEIGNGDSYKAHPFRAGSPNDIGLVDASRDCCVNA